MGTRARGQGARGLDGVGGDRLAGGGGGVHVPVVRPADRVGSVVIMHASLPGPDDGTVTAS